MMLFSPADAPPPPSSPQRIVVLASGSGSNFASIAAAIEGGELVAELRGVVCNNPGAYVLERARVAGVASAVVDHRAYATREGHDEAVVAAIRDFGADWVVMAGWMRIATGVLLEAFPGRILNVHPSLLPAFRGLHAVEQAIAAGVRISGCTVHVVTPSLDDGPIIAQAAVPVLPGDDAAALHARIHAVEHILYPRAIGMAVVGELG